MCKLKNELISYKTELLLAVIGIPIGIIIGILDSVFGQVLLKLSDIREMYYPYLIFFLPIVGMIIVFFYNRFGGKSGKGMNLVFEVGQGDEEVIPLRLIPFVVSGTWLTHLFGGSAGREGVAVQIGATFSHWIGRHLKIKNAPQIFLVAGMAAGFSGLFETPIAAVLFAMEVLVAGEIRYEALFPALTASVSACVTSKMLGLSKFSFALTDSTDFSAELFLKLFILGIIFGIVGGLFAWVLKKAKTFFAEKIKNPIIRIGLIGFVLSILLFVLYNGRYSGLGTNLIEKSFNGGTVYYWDWILKFILTIITLAAGYQGGEVTPLFSIGSTLGAVLAPLFGISVEFSSALGYVAIFASATNTFFAPVFIGAEIFGFKYMPYFFIVCTVSYLFNFNTSIYSLQKRHVFHLKNVD